MSAGNRALNTWLGASAALCVMATLSLALTGRWGGAGGAQATPVASVQDVVDAAGGGNKQAVGAEGTNKDEYELSISRSEAAGATDTALRLVV